MPLEPLNHLERSLSRLPAQYRGKPRWEALFVRFWAAALQAQEDALQALKVQLDWRTATGTWLDLWGDVAQIPRPASPEYASPDGDARYRASIAARWASMRSRGSGDELLLVALELWPDAEGVNVEVPTDPAELETWEPPAWGLKLSQHPPGGAQLDIYTPIDEPLTAADRAIASEVLYAAAPLAAQLMVTTSIPGDPTFGTYLPAQDRVEAARERRAGTFVPPTHTDFMDRLRAGVYTPSTFGWS